MIVCLDSGNSRIKWGVHDGNAWLAQGAVAHAEVGQLASLPARWGRPGRVMLANVAGAEAAQRIRQQLQAWAPLFCDVQPVAERAGVTNLYQNPARLGVDRWCALIGARGLFQQASIVVMAGTATTIDSLDAAGVFLGGMILPGLDLMRRALVRETAGLPFADGQYAEQPRCTDDAIVTGCIEAQAGAIERAWTRLNAGDALCVMSGGNAEVISKHLSIAHVLTPNLPLEGLRLLAVEP
ncbi:hypothetical protein AT959_19875 [Dechloromonas denitrificans]|uniref:Type III pantothenate kinase n=1 Tax=Dechloromonas denitrificans TaxID=281362 RepID=A0A133XDR2_9RHOO|nr:type III pantothenate kinase [Dechloromonas denitrificans]KXB29075.1 hypothetical protein AT959_19875 [Dechloromonas denitrificans]